LNLPLNNDNFSSMKILLIGSGGREHSIALKLAESPKLSSLFIAPGNAGTAQVGTNVSIKDSDLDKLLDFALSESIDLTIVGPEAPLVSGIVDLFNNHNLAIIGPSKEGAQLEGSKEWAKKFMEFCNIPTASYYTSQTYDDALDYIKTKNTFPIVIKADGLAAGKGVTVAESLETAERALKECFIENIFKEAGAKVVIEDFLKGEEASIFAFTDGKTIVPMVPAQDHKAIFEGDKGPNTGGMGAYTPAPIVTSAIYDKVQKTVFEPLLKGFQDKNITYKGIVYAGLMIDGEDVNIVEFNVRFGDPETQVVLQRLDSDLLEIFLHIAQETLSDFSIQWNNDSVACVVLASGGYPGPYNKGEGISGLDNIDPSQAVAIHAGTSLKNDKFVTSGGRVLAVVGKDPDLATALNKAYTEIKKVSFNDMYYRKDIGFKAFKTA